jgi:flagellar basal-body rod protein FlgG
MAITALHAAATGMQAQDMKLDVLANNLANVNTVGFKRARVNFEDLLYQIKREPGIPNAQNEPIPHGIQVGLGVAVSGTQQSFQQGSVDQTDQPFDVMIEGQGFFQVQTIHDGDLITAYTRNGNFTRNSVGNLVLANSEGAILEPPITIPDDLLAVVIGANGEVAVRSSGSPTLSVVGQFDLARFVNPEGLAQIGQNLWRETNASGPAITGTAQTDGLGSITQGALEMSNVDPVRELVQLILTQRSFEINSQTIQAADEALQVVANLRRF